MIPYNATHEFVDICLYLRYLTTQHDGLLDNRRATLTRHGRPGYRRVGIAWPRREAGRQQQ